MHKGQKYLAIADRYVEPTCYIHMGNNISETYPRWIGQGLDEVSFILSSTAVGNSPLILDEYPTGLGNVIISWINLVIVPKTRQHFRPRNVVLAIVDF